MSAAIIRPVAPADFEQWLPLWEGYNAFYGRSGATALPEPITQTTWQRRLYEKLADRSGFIVYRKDV
jgi:hypothetical protein